MNINEFYNAPTPEYLPDNKELIQFTKESLFYAGFHERKKEFLIFLNKSIDLWQRFDLKEKPMVPRTHGKCLQQPDPDYKSLVLAAFDWFSKPYFNLLLDKAILSKNVSMRQKQDLLLKLIENKNQNIIEKLLNIDFLNNKDVISCFYLHKTKELQDGLDFSNYKKIIDCWTSFDYLNWRAINNNDNFYDIYDNMSIVIKAWGQTFSIEKKLEINATLISLVNHLTQNHKHEYLLKSFVEDLIKSKLISYETPLMKDGAKIELIKYFEFLDHEIEEFIVVNKEFKAEQRNWNLSQGLTQKETQCDLVKI